MTFSDLPIYTADDVMGAVPYAAAVDAIEEALRGSVDPADDPARSFVEIDAGQLLLMPSAGGAYAGVKLATVAPDNPARGLPRIQAVYVLFDAATLSPVALLDGSALTTLRTPAVSAAAARHLTPERLDRLVVFGTGPQGGGHVDALGSIRELGEVNIVGRDATKAAALAERLVGKGFDASVGTVDGVREADVIVCATTAETPLFDGALVRENACVLAIGAHTPDHRELDSGLMGRSTVVVEDHDTALREAGDVVLAAADGALDIDDTVPLRDLVNGTSTRTSGRPAVFKGTGMSWQDLAVASVAYERLRSA
ncbi:ornithine cyclodeaminase family protein [Solicola gregarius]|uniref:Ornithine cyclodeaminase family protein n=1 Tax=Solicola gregarius TaxID=2908642 RepID=A0AA46YLP3_9ACTN|nr:ornithine cyclodeaminase family protein [Solicola gregarius]UYM05711.1 ornithine cyclodeaminase family protein [Solicola gregarius]